MSDRLLKTKEVAEMLNVSRDKVLDLINRCDLEAIELGPKTIRIYESSVRRLIGRPNDVK